MPAPLIQLQDISVRFGNSQVLDGASLSIDAGDRLCLVGRNGSGKSTLLKVAAGLLEPDAGTRFAQPGATIRYLHQEPDFAGFRSVREFVEAGLGDGYDADRTFHLLGKLGLSGNEVPEQLSGGEKRRAALARALAPEPDILLLDEPTNHLDLPAIEWLEQELSSLPSALVLISHDRRFLEDLSRATVWLDRGRTRRLNRGFRHFENWRDEALASEEVEQHKVDRRIAAEEDWVRYGVSGRRKRNQGRLARLRELRTARREQLKPVGAVKFAAAESEAGSSRLIEAHGVSKWFGGRCIVREFSIRIARKDRIGIVGPNGIGKTTLLNLLTGCLRPDTGSVKIAAGVQLAVLDQSRVAALQPDDTVSAILAGGTGDTVDVRGQKRHVVSYMKDFLFTPQQARTPVRILSGGERGRLLLAKVMAQRSNLLVLDEPTNDLDLETIDLLEELLSDYPGTVLVVSHDRDFLDRAVTSILRGEGDGRFLEYAGGYSDMLTQLPDEAVRPDRPAAPRKNRRASVTDTQRRQMGGGRLSFHQQHAMKTLPGQIATLESERAMLQGQLSDSSLYMRDQKAFTATSARLKRVETELADAEERWLELAALEEELG